MFPKWLEYISILLVLYSTVCIGLETTQNLPAGLITFLSISEKVILVFFVIEYVYRWKLSEDRPRFVWSFYSIIDLVAIVPSLIIPALDMRSLRLIRLLRIARLAKLLKYQSAIGRLVSAFKDSREELIIWTLGSSIIVYLAALGIYHAEHGAQPEIFRSIGDGLWWAVATLTTVGYGDIYPITSLGKVLTTAILLVGLGMVAVPTAIFSSSLSALKKADLSDGS